MLGRAMEKTATLKNVSLTQGDVTKMPFQNNQFDGICCNQVHIFPLATRYRASLISKYKNKKGGEPGDEASTYMATSSYNFVWY